MEGEEVVVGCRFGEGRGLDGGLWPSCTGAIVSRVWKIATGWFESIVLAGSRMTRLEIFCIRQTLPFFSRSFLRKTHFQSSSALEFYIFCLSAGICV